MSMISFYLHRTEHIRSHSDLLLDVIRNLGWLVNFEKSSLEPSQCKEFIGYLIDNSGDKTVN